MSKQRVQRQTSFDDLEELAKAKKMIPEGETFSDFVRRMAFKLPPREAKSGARKGDEHWKKQKVEK